MFLYKLKQNREQRKTNAAEPAVSSQRSERDRSRDTAVNVATKTSFQLQENRKRKASSDLRHDDDVPGKRPKFSSLFTNNPEIPRVER